MGLDPWTLWTVVLLVCGLVTGVMLFAWAVGPAEHSLAYWAAGIVFIVVALLCGFAHESLPTRLAIFLGHGAVLTGYALFWSSLRCFRGRLIRWRWVVAVPVLWGAFCLWPGADDALAVRIVLHSVLTAGLLGLALRELWGSDGRGRISQRGLLTVLGLLLAMQLARIVFVQYFADAPGVQPVALVTPAGQAFGLGALTCLFLASFLLTLAVRERREAHFADAARRDALTGLSNRRDFHARAAEICRRGGDIALLLLDLDHFKQVNDLYGHSAGDTVLTAFAAVLAADAPAGAVIARLGGEEFVALVPAMRQCAAQVLAERWRRSLVAASGALGLGGANAALQATVSIGIAFGRLPAAESAEEAEARLQRALAQADVALYAAKAGGRNRVETIAFTPSGDSSLS